MTTSNQRPWPRHPRYLVGDDGSVVGITGRILRPYTNGKDYQRLGLLVNGHRKTFAVHVMVAETWHGPRPLGMQAAHGNGNPSDNRAVNLRWATPTENAADKILHGTSNRGERHGNHQLRAVNVRAILRLSQTTPLTQAELGAMFDVDPGTVRDILAGLTWSHLTGISQQSVVPYGGRKHAAGERHGNARFTEQDVRDIRAAHAGGESVAGIARRLNCSEGGVRHIVKRRAWGHVA